jgi:hypothetical protein
MQPGGNLDSSVLGIPFAEECWNYVSLARTGNLSVFKAIAFVIKLTQSAILYGNYNSCCLEHLDYEKQQEIQQGNSNIHKLEGNILSRAKNVSYRMKKKHADTFKEWLLSQV